MRVLAAMSGGVDSSYVAALLRKEGHEITGVTMKVWQDKAQACPAGLEAVELAEKANQFTGGGDPLILRTLAAAYASNKSFDKALETSRRALQYAQEQHNLDAAEAIRREMSRYEVGQQPYQAR